MKAIRLPFIVILFAVFVVGSAIAAQAKKPEIYRTSGLTAAAYFNSLDESGCVYTGIFVEFGQKASGATPPKPGEQPAIAYMYIDRRDMCGSGVPPIYAQTTEPPTLPEGAAQVDPSLRSANLNATVALQDSNTGATITADVSIAWTATGTSYRSNNHDHVQSEWVVVNASSRGITRDASVVGSVIVDGVNLTPSPWGQSWIENSIEVAIDIYKTH